MTSKARSDDNATTWRDLADQLTPEQVASFEGMERHFAEQGVGDQPQAKGALLRYARDYAERNVVDAVYADVALPPGATTDSESWSQDLHQGGWRRSVLWRMFGEPHRNVEISGWQRTDGSFTRNVCVWGVGEGEELTSSAARHIAALLIEAADELDRMR
jgi:hypothetical protein